jgi:TldD protein
MTPAATPAISEFGSGWQDSLSWLLGTAMTAGADFAEIFLERSRQQTVNSRDGKISDCDSLHTVGAGIRVARGMNTSYVSTTDLTLTGLSAGMTKALAAAGCDDNHRTRWVQDIHFEPLRDYGRLRVKNAWLEQSPGLQEMSERTLKLDSLIQSGVNHAQSTGANFRSHWQEVLVANTEGVFARDIRLTDFLLGNAICADGAHRFEAGKTGGATGSPRWLSSLDLERFAAEIADSAGSMLHADFVEAGQYPIVIGNGFGGVILHEACGHLLETHSLIRKVSPFAGKRGEQIAHPAVTAWDEGRSDGYYGSIDMDDEGMPAQATLLIENGVLRNYLIDRLGSSRLNLPRTGSGRRESYRFAPTARMRNTFFAPGPHSEADLIASVDHGLYCKKMGGGSVDAAGDFNFAVREAWEIKNGKLVRPLKGASLIGSGQQILQHISMVAGDLKLEPGHCGSISGRIFTTCGQPHVKVDTITVGGR